MLNISAVVCVSGTHLFNMQNKGRDQSHQHRHIFASQWAHVYACGSLFNFCSDINDLHLTIFSESTKRLELKSLFGSSNIQQLHSLPDEGLIIHYRYDDAVHVCKVSRIM